MALAVSILAACASPPPRPPSPAETPAVAAPPPMPADTAAAGPGATMQQPRSRWVAGDWTDLAGFADDRLLDWWPAFVQGCSRPARGWSTLCAEAQLRPPTTEVDLRIWLVQNLQPWRVEALPGSSESANGLLTGYFEPLIEARRTRQGPFQTALHQLPTDLAQRRPYWTRQELDSVAAAKASLRGREIAWVADPLDALVLQIQGSGRLWWPDADGSPRTVRLAFAGHNDQPYRSVGRWLIDQGELRAGEASWPAIKAWAQRNPQRLQEMLWSNPRVVFFREETLPANGGVIPGPRGAQGVPLTARRSIAVDPQSVPYGSPVWLDSTEPLSSTPLQRLVMAQDTGGAIVGAVRADYFWGSGDDAEAQAGRMKQALRMWVLWPR